MAMALALLLAFLSLSPALSLTPGSPAPRHLWPRTLAGVEVGAHKSSAPSIASATRAASAGAEYFWPSGRGRPGHYTASPHAGPFNLTASLSWTWHNPAGRYATTPTGVAIDGEKNIYLSELAGIRKFSPDGQEIWAYGRKNPRTELVNAASLLDGRVYSSSMDGRIFAVSMETGEEVWSTQAGNGTDGNNGFVSAFAGTVIAGITPTNYWRGRAGCCGVANLQVAGLNATDGEVLWKFQPDVPVWNFLASFADDDTFTFQDLEGRVYRSRIRDGSLVWKAGGKNGTWTDGSSVMGSNGIVYAVHTYSYGGADPDGPGDLSAYRLSDGRLLWNVTTPRPPNNVPAIGRLTGRSSLSVVQPMGQQCTQGNPTDVYAYDAETGQLQWVFNGPTQKGVHQAGEKAGAMGRTLAGVRPITLPNPWSAPSIDGKGTVYIGSEEGGLYALRDANLDGRLTGDEEVSILPTDACFVGSSSAAFAPGMMAAASIDQLYVFKSFARGAACWLSLWLGLGAGLALTWLSGA